MRLTRVFVEAPIAAGELLVLPPAAAQHLVKVLRLPTGALVRVFNGRGGEFEGRIEIAKRDAVTVRIDSHHAIERESPLQITLLQGIARGDKMDLILQKATELGISRVVPLLTLRSTVKLDAAAADRKRGHWQAVVASASEQCGRNRIAEVLPPANLPAAVAAAQADLKLLLAPDEDSASLQDALAGASSGVLPSVCLLVGPEGGFDPLEIRAARMAGFVGCRLGPRVLRTETAALTALAALQTLVGDLM